jgi:hypothetical protein
MRSVLSAPDFTLSCAPAAIAAGRAQAGRLAHGEAQHV